MESMDAGTLGARKKPATLDDIQKYVPEFVHGKQHLDEAKKLADELADHDLIWLCDKHTRARASLEC